MSSKLVNRSRTLSDRLTSFLGENKSAEEITAELFASLNLTAANIGGQLTNLDNYRSALDKIVRTGLKSMNKSLLVQAQPTAERADEDNKQTGTTTTDTREYTEKRVQATEEH